MPTTTASVQNLSSGSLPTVIVGGGFVGLFTALHLRHHHYTQPIVLIDPQSQFVFKPLLYEYLSGEMQAEEVVPTYEELLSGSEVTFVQGNVTQVDFSARRVVLASGLHYDYQCLVLAVGSTQGFFGTQGAKEYAFPFRTQTDALRLKSHLRDCLQRASQIEDQAQREALLTVAVVGGGPAGVEMAATLADLLPEWYGPLGGNNQELRIVLVNHGDEILAGDVNAHLQETALHALKNRALPVELLLGVRVEAVSEKGLTYSAKGDDFGSHLPAATAIWTAGTATNPLIESLPLGDGDRDKHKSPLVTDTLQLPSYPEVFAAGDCAIVQSAPQPPVAQIAYQQGAGIARNLIAIAQSKPPQPVQAHMRGTLMKLGLHNGVANLFDKVQIKGEAGDLIRNGIYLEMLPTPLHNFKAITEWLTDDIFARHLPTEHAEHASLQKSFSANLPSPNKARQNYTPLWLVGIALALTLAIGLFFGFHP